MRFALIDNTRVEAEPGLRGCCPICLQPVIAKCGTQRIRHWAHSSNSMCDRWWEPETEWHRSWKSNFPADCQEIICESHTGEKHIADVCIYGRLVIEFQHSHIEPTERIKREKFYKNMVWVVDGTRLKGDYARFLRREKDFKSKEKPGIFQIDNPKNCFPKAWLDSSVPVIFDFMGTESVPDESDRRNSLYCLFPIRLRTDAIFAKISRKSFVKHCINGVWELRISDYVLGLQQEQELQNQIENQHLNIIFEESNINAFLGMKDT